MTKRRKIQLAQWKYDDMCQLLKNERVRLRCSKTRIQNIIRAKRLAKKLLKQLSIPVVKQILQRSAKA